MSAIRLFAFTLILVFSQSTHAQDTWWQVDRWKEAGWKTDFDNKNIDLSEVQSGGPPKDGIPPIDNPKFISVSAETELTPQDPVIGLEINGDARAYPLRVMTWHEIVNDMVGGTPVAVTYCPLCNAAIVFDTRINGKKHTFGTTGKLRKSDLIMYDRTTESWWQQFTGEAIAGSYTGQKLQLIPARLESWKDFTDRFPNGKVLVPNNPNMRDYGRNPYQYYDISKSPFLYSGSMPKDIPAMARVIIIKRDGKQPLILSQQKVRNAGAVTLDGIKISWKSGQASALHESIISSGRDVGSIVVQDFQTGKDLPYDVTFAFVAHAFHPKIAIKK